MKSEKPPRVAIFPAQYESLSEVRDFVGQAAEETGLDSAAIYAVMLAVDEAFTNIIEHAYGGESEEKIECGCQVSSTELTITLRDCGRPFEPDEVPDPDLEASLEERSIGGLGLYFMRQLMDEVHFSFVPASGDKGNCNILTMIKRKET